ncbi:MAG: hypothetical protein IJH78_07225 [Clostridia bacterium]|nr:hypothetical protein [Clostridia bacterium]
MPYILCFCISAAFLLATLVLLFKNRKESLLVLTAGTYFMLLALLLPLGWRSGSAAWSARHFLLQLRESLEVFSLDSDFALGMVYQIAPSAGEGFAWVYSLYLAVLYALAPFLTVGLLITLSRRASSLIQRLTCLRGETWIFAEASDKALLFAENILAAKGESIRVIICGADEERYRLVRETGAIPFMKSIDMLSHWYLDRRPATVLFLSDDETQAMEQALKFIARWKEAPRRKTLMYVFASLTGSGLMLDEAVRGIPGPAHPVCRRIAENRQLAYREIQEMDRLLPRNKSTRHFLLVGCGWIGLELLRALIWNYACEDNQLIIDVVDRENCKKRFYRECPALQQPETRNAYHYNIRFHIVEDVRSFDVATLPDIRGIDCVLVALGNDARNLDCALRLRRAFRRAHLAQGAPDPDLPLIRAVFDEAVYREHPLEPYGIGVIGGTGGKYALSTLVNAPLELCAFLDHLAWQGVNLREEPDSPEKREKTEKLKELFSGIEALRAQAAEEPETFRHADLREAMLQIEDFYSNDYNSYSSRARALYELRRGGLHDPDAEHRRWTLYMMTEGWTYGNVRGKDAVAGLHRELTYAARPAVKDKDRSYREVWEALQSRAPEKRRK